MTREETIKKMARLMFENDSGASPYCWDKYKTQYIEMSTAAYSVIEPLLQNEQRLRQDISTAPMDNTPLILTVKGRVFTGYWNPELETWQPRKGNFFTDWPTHWQPLPKPPAINEGE